MENNCVFCRKKFTTFNRGTSILEAVNYPSKNENVTTAYATCFECKKHVLKLIDDLQLGSHNEVEATTKVLFKRGGVREEIADAVIAIITKYDICGLYKNTGSTPGDMVQQLIDEKREKEHRTKQIETERLERTRLMDEDKLRKEREERYKIRLNNLQNTGADGYYEYKVLSLLDIDGFLNSNSGRVNTTAMTTALNELGLDGWHLVTAYSNELGKNALSGGVGIAMLGINSTIDENILIFERFVKF